MASKAAIAGLLLELFRDERRSSMFILYGHRLPGSRYEKLKAADNIFSKQKYDITYYGNSNFTISNSQHRHLLHNSGAGWLMSFIQSTLPQQRTYRSFYVNVQQNRLYCTFYPSIMV